MTVPASVEKWQGAYLATIGTVKFVTAQANVKKATSLIRSL